MIDLERLDRFIQKVYDPTTLPDFIHYHTLGHTRQVEEAGRLIAHGEGITGVDLNRLRAGIKVHDIGNILGREGHEAESLKMAKSPLGYCGADAEDLAVIEGIVMRGTVMPHKPQTLLEKAMADADMSLMGLPSWLEDIDGYRLELGIDDLAQWYSGQVGFLQTHSWFTPTAAKLYDRTKAENIERARRAFEALRS